MGKMDITPILELAVKLIFTLITIFLIPKIKELLAAKVAESDQKKLLRWAELAVQAAEEAARIALAAAQETNFSIYSDRVRFVAVGVRKTSIHYDYLTGDEIKEILA